MPIPDELLDLRVSPPNHLIVSIESQYAYIYVYNEI